MKKLIIIILFAFLFLIIGCGELDYSKSPQGAVIRAEQNIANIWRNNPLTEGYWYQENCNLEDATKVCQDCLLEAKKATVNVYPIHIQASNEVSLFLDCMKIRDYKYYLPDKLPANLRTKRIEYVGVAGR